MSGFSGRRLARLVLAGAGGAVAAGVVVGGVARLLMSGITIAAAEQSSFSLIGTLGVFIAFGMLAVPAAFTAAASRAVRVAGRWVTACVTGWAVATTGFVEGEAIILAPDARMNAIAILVVGFGIVVVAHGHVAQYVARRMIPEGPAAQGAHAAPAGAEPANR